MRTPNEEKNALVKTLIKQGASNEEIRSKLYRKFTSAVSNTTIAELRRQMLISKVSEEFYFKLINQLRTFYNKIKKSAEDGEIPVVVINKIVKQSLTYDVKVKLDDKKKFLEFF